MGFSALLVERQHYGITPEPDKKALFLSWVNLLSNCSCMRIELLM